MIRNHGAKAVKEKRDCKDVPGNASVLVAPLELADGAAITGRPASEGTSHPDSGYVLQPVGWSCLGYFFGRRDMVRALIAAALLATVSFASTVRAATLQTAVFAGGCFWGVEAVFEHVKGVKAVVSGYAGGTVVNPDYETVSSGRTGHAEAVKVTFDPAVVSYETLLAVFFTVAHNPTELNRQGPDVGTQYRSAIFFSSAEQQKSAATVIAQLTQAKAFSRPIVTQLASLSKFYDAESYHQNYLYSHTDQPYIVYNDLPKIDALKKQYPALWEKTQGK